MAKDNKLIYKSFRQHQSTKLCHFKLKTCASGPLEAIFSFWYLCVLQDLISIFNRWHLRQVEWERTVKGEKLKWMLLLLCKKIFIGTPLEWLIFSNAALSISNYQTRQNNSLKLRRRNYNDNDQQIALPLQFITLNVHLEYKLNVISFDRLPQNQQIGKKSKSDAI